MYDDDDAEKRYRRYVDGLTKMREEAADDVLQRPELKNRRRSSFCGEGEVERRVFEVVVAEERRRGGGRRSEGAE